MFRNRIVCFALLGVCALVTTIAVPGLGNGPRHTEHELPADRQLFANGFGTGRTFVFDLSTPDAPRITGEFGDVGT